MLPGDVGAAIDGYLAALKREAPGQIAAVYAGGGIALDDFSSKLSNIDLIVVWEPALDLDRLAVLRGAERRLRRAGRPAAIWHTTWDEIADGTESRALLGGQVLATPMTRALLRRDPMALVGPDWPVVAHDDAMYRAWCLDRLRALAEGRKGLLILRRRVTPLVLECARLAQGAITGRLFSKSEAGESVGPLVSSRYRRILTDAVGYRRGAQTSMYWGPFERKYDALVLVRDLLDAAASP